MAKIFMGGKRHLVSRVINNIVFMAAALPPPEKPLVSGRL
jgi:hypothetical protein